MDHVVDAAPATWSFNVPPIAVDGVTHIRRPPSRWIRLRRLGDAVLKIIAIAKAIEWVVGLVRELFHSAATVERKHV